MTKIVDHIKKLLAKRLEKQQAPQQLPPPSRFHWSDEDFEVLPEEKKINEALLEKEKLSPIYHVPQNNTISKSKLSKNAKAHYLKISKTFKHHHHTAINEYTGDLHADMNKALRKGSSRVDPELGKHIDHLKEVTAHKTPEDHVVYRGFSRYGRKAKSVDLTKLKRGQILRDKGFTSTSLDPHTATEFAHEDNHGYHMAKIHVPKGSKGHYVGGVEKELVLHPGTKFKVLGHSVEHNSWGDQYHFVHMKVAK